MGNTIVVSENQLIEFKQQLQILYFRLKTNGFTEEDIKTHMYAFYGFYVSDTSTMRPKIVRSLTGALNGCIKIEHREDLSCKIHDLYSSEGLLEEEIAIRMNHLTEFFATASDDKRSSSKSMDSGDIYSSPNGAMIRKSSLVRSSSYEESAEEAYVRQQDEKRTNTLKAKVVAVEAADYLMRSGSGARGARAPDIYKSPSKSPSVLEREKTPNSNGKTTLPVIVTPEQCKSASSAIDKLKKAVSSDTMAMMRASANAERRYSTGDLLSDLSPLRKAADGSHCCILCGAVFPSHNDLCSHVTTANAHIDTVEASIRKHFDFCDPYVPNKSDEDLPYKFLITRRKLFNESREAYKADFYLHMSMNILEVALLLIGKEKKFTCSLYFDNSKLNGILHKLYGIMRNSKAHQEALSSYVIDRLGQDRKSGMIQFVPNAKDSKDVGSVVLKDIPIDLVSAGWKQLQSS